MHANLIQATCTSKTLKNQKTSNQAQAETTDTENQDLLKDQTLSSTKKIKKIKIKFKGTKS
jgi:hypothetical protein